MSEDNARRTIEVDEEFLEELYGLVGKMPPGAKGINVDLLKDLLLDIKRKFDRLQNGGGTDNSAQEKTSTSGRIVTKGSRSALEKAEEEKDPAKQILIIDDLGVITYQLSVLFKNIGYEVTVAKEIYDAIDKYKKQDYEFVIMDLFIPTDREGFMLLDELVKLYKMNKYHSKIGVMTASSKKEHRQLCMKKGADFYIEKVEDWQSTLLDYCNK